MGFDAARVDAEFCDNRTCGARYRRKHGYNWRKRKGAAA